MNKIVTSPVGLSYRNEEIRTLRPKGAIQLEPEPENKYDSKAIAVKWKGFKIGYIAREKEQNAHNPQAWIWDKWNRGVPIKCEVEEAWVKYEKNKKYSLAGVKISCEALGDQEEIKTPTNAPKKVFCPKCGGETFLSKNGNNVCKKLCWKKIVIDHDRINEEIKRQEDEWGEIPSLTNF